MYNQAKVEQMKNAMKERYKEIRKKSERQNEIMSNPLREEQSDLMTKIDKLQEELRKNNKELFERYEELVLQEEKESEEHLVLGNGIQILKHYCDHCNKRIDNIEEIDFELGIVEDYSDFICKECSKTLEYCENCGGLLGTGEWEEECYLCGDKYCSACEHWCEDMENEELVEQAEEEKWW